MKNKFVKMFLPIIMILTLSGCKDVPSNSLYKEEYEKVRTSVKSLLGQEYDAINFREIKEGYSNDQKTEYEVEFKFDLNKPVPIVGIQKDIPGTLKFEKRESKWVCTLNTGNTSGFFNLLK
jgi:hypothetical protein